MVEEKKKGTFKDRTRLVIYNNAMNSQANLLRTEAVNAIANSQTDAETKATAERIKKEGDELNDSEEWGAAVQKYGEVLDLMTENKPTRARFAKELPTYHDGRYDKKEYKKLGGTEKEKLWNAMRVQYGINSDLSYLTMGRFRHTPDELMGAAKEVLNIKKKNTPKIQNLDHGEELGVCVKKFTSPSCFRSDIWDGKIWKECQINNANCRNSPSLGRNIPSCAKRNERLCPNDSDELLAWRVLYDEDMGIRAREEATKDAEYEEHMARLSGETKEEAMERREATNKQKREQALLDLADGDDGDDRSVRDWGALPGIIPRTDEERREERREDRANKELELAKRKLAAFNEEVGSHRDQRDDEEEDETRARLEAAVQDAEKNVTYTRMFETPIKPGEHIPKKGGGRRRRKTRAVKRNKKKRTTRKNKNIKKLTKKRRPKKRKGTRKRSV